jgi:hypothetical protein
VVEAAGCEAEETERVGGIAMYQRETGIHQPLLDCLHPLLLIVRIRCSRSLLAAVYFDAQV